MIYLEKDSGNGEYGRNRESSAGGFCLRIEKGEGMPGRMSENHEAKGRNRPAAAGKRKVFPEEGARTPGN